MSRDCFLILLIPKENQMSDGYFCLFLIQIIKVFILFSFGIFFRIMEVYKVKMYLKSYDQEEFRYHLYIHRMAVLHCSGERGGHYSTLDPVWRVPLELCNTVCDGEFPAQDASGVSLDQHWHVLEHVGFEVEISWIDHLLVQSCAIDIIL